MNINKEICYKAIKNGIIPNNTYYITFLLLNNPGVDEEFLDDFLSIYNYDTSATDFVSSKSIIKEFEELGLIKITGENFKDFSLRDSGRKLLSFDDTDTLRELARKMIDLFPVGVKSGGYPVRASVNDVTDKLKKFLKNNKYTHEEILKATERYVNRKKLENYSFMQRIVYFIEKDKFSSLASEIEDMKASKEDKLVDYKFEDRL